MPRRYGCAGVSGGKVRLAKVRLTEWIYVSFRWYRHRGGARSKVPCFPSLDPFWVPIYGGGGVYLTLPGPYLPNVLVPYGSRTRPKTTLNSAAELALWKDHHGRYLTLRTCGSELGMYCNTSTCRYGSHSSRTFPTCSVGFDSTHSRRIVTDRRKTLVPGNLVLTGVDQ
jgi:hypothetical protein